MKIKWKAILIIIVGLAISTGQSAWASDKDSVDDEEKVSAVQNRLFHRNHELSASIGYIADDAFYVIYPVSIGYTYNFSDNWGWEVGRLQYFINQERGLIDELLDLNAAAARFQEPKYMIDSHIVWKPLYGKSALLNHKVINHETYLFAGGGVTRYETNYSYGESDTEDAMNISFGAGFKYFINQKFCLNVEVRDILNFRKDDNENNIYFGLGLGWRFNLAPRKVEEDPTLKKLDNILSD